MRKKASPILSMEPGLEEAKQRFEEWRSVRKKSEAIPAELLDAAAALVRYHPVCRVSKVLHLNPGRLKERVRAIAQDVYIEKKDSPFFIEASLGPLAVPGSGPTHCIELTAMDGSRMKLSWAGGALNPLPLCQAFWQSRR